MWGMFFFFLDLMSCVIMGVVVIKIFVNFVLIGIYIFVLIVIFVKLVGFVCFDIVVLKKFIVNNDICVMKIGKNSNINCFNFCENEVVFFIKFFFCIKK